MEVWVEAFDVLDQRGLALLPGFHGGLASIQNLRDRLATLYGWPERWVRRNEAI